MNFIKKVDRYHRIDQLIQQQCTGAPKNFAIKLGVNRSHLYRLINFMKDYGAPIEYSRKLQTFYYSKPFEFSKVLTRKVLSMDQMEQINGGVSNFLLPSPIMRRKDFSFTVINLKFKDYENIGVK